ncbi:MAG: polysaccharide biosynthesis tyrosine autokinase [Planctomycetota bacterium]
MTANPLSTIPPIGPTTGMTPAPMPGKFKPIDPVRLLRQHLPLLIVAGVIGVVVGGVAWYIARQVDPQFRSQAKLMATGQVDPNEIRTTGGMDSGEIAEIETFIRNQIAVITSDDMLRAAIQWPSVRNTQWFQTFNDDVRLAAKALQDEHLRVVPQRDSTLITLNMRMSNPADAQTVLDALITVYLNDRQIRLENDMSRLTASQIRERERADEELRRLQLERRRFIEENDLATVRIEHTEASIAYDTLNRQRVAMEMELNAARASITGLIQSNEENPDRPMTETEEQQLRLLQPVALREETIRQYNESIRSMKAMGLGDGHRMVRELQERIAATEQELDGLMKLELGKLRAAQVAGAVSMEEQIQAQLGDMQRAVDTVHGKMRDMTQTLALFDSIESEILSIREQKVLIEENLAELRRLAMREDVTRVTRAVPPTEAELASPMWFVWIPGVTMFCVGSVAGLIFLRELTDQRVKSPADIKLLPEATLLGVLPDGKEDPSGNKEVSRAVEMAPTGLMAESFRQVRTAVLSRMDRRGYKTIVLVAAQPEAGTSSVAQNLAASLAYNGRRVLIIDANFRRPSQHDLADASNSRGLVDVLRDDVEVEDVIQTHPDLSLSVLTAGQASEAPPELLEGANFRSLLGRLESEYDVVIIDAPPALLTSDAQLLAKHVDAIAVVVRAGSDKRGMVERMLAKLDGQRADVLGIILNGVQSSAGGYFRKSYEDFYNYHRSSSNGSNGSADRGRKSKDRGKATAEAVTADSDTETL